jgi:hypothetical protein
MQLDLSMLGVPVSVPAVPVGQKPGTGTNANAETFDLQGFSEPVPVVPAVPVHFEKVHAKAGQLADSEPKAGDWWGSYEAMATDEALTRKQPARTGPKPPQEQTIAEWVAEYEAAEAHYREIDL